MRPYLIVIWLHFIGDFIFQSDWMAKNKSDDISALVLHGATYALPLFYFGWVFACANAGWHMAVDAVTSKITKRLWLAEKRHWFFVVIGLDQAIHLTFLFTLCPFK